LSEHDRSGYKIEEFALSTKEQVSATTAMAQSAEWITNQTHHSDSALQRAAEEVRKLNGLGVGLQLTIKPMTYALN